LPFRSGWLTVDAGEPLARSQGKSRPPQHFSMALHSIFVSSPFRKIRRRWVQASPMARPAMAVAVAFGTRMGTWRAGEGIGGTPGPRSTLGRDSAARVCSCLDHRQHRGGCGASRVVRTTGHAPAPGWRRAVFLVFSRVPRAGGAGPTGLGQWGGRRASWALGDRSVHSGPGTERFCDGEEYLRRQPPLVRNG
jgi:hypothetical protein